MTLKERIDKLKEASRGRVPEEIRAVMERAVEDLRRSGIRDRVKKPGDKAPKFSLPDPDGRLVSSRDLLARGPLVVSFYRGKW